MIQRFQINKYSAVKLKNKCFIKCKWCVYSIFGIFPSIYFLSLLLEVFVGNLSDLLFSINF